MKRLNPCLDNNLVPGRPEIKTWEIYGKRFAYDVNSMDVYQLNKDENPPTAYDYAPQFKLHTAIAPSYIVLNVTDACNLRCRYCFVRNYRPPSSSIMTFDIAKRAIGLVQPEIDGKFKNIMLSFFGGEPLLALDLIKTVVKYGHELAQKRKVMFVAGMTTNATLITPEVAKFIDDNRLSLIVSLDGIEKVHNKNRPMRNGNSWLKTTQALELLKSRKSGSEIVIRASYTGEDERLLDTLIYLNELCDNGLADSVAYEPISLAEHGCRALPDGHKLAITIDNVEKFRDEYHRISEWILSRMREGRPPRFVHYGKLMARLAFQQCSPSECGAGVGYCAVNADGTIYACHRQGDGMLGNVWDGIDESKRARWIDNRLYARTGCSECWLRWFCGGGCRLCSLDRGLSIHEPEPVACWYRKTFMEEICWLMSEMTQEEIISFCGMYSHDQNLSSRFMKKIDNTGTKDKCLCEKR